MSRQRSIAARRPCRRGGAYVMTLGVSMLITVIGLSSLLVVRLENRTRALTASAMSATIQVQSAMELALYSIRGNANWRQTYLNGVWTERKRLGPGTLSWKLVDETDGSLANDWMDPVRIHVRAEVGPVVRLASIVYDPSQVPQEPQLVRNGDCEDGDHHWDKVECDLKSRSGGAHGGSKYLAVENRKKPISRMRQDVRNKLANGATYECRAWVRAASGGSGQVDVSLGIELKGQHSGEADFRAPPVTVGTAWTEVVVRLAPVWSGSLESARLYVIAANLDAFDVDDVSQVRHRPEVVQPVLGTWRQEVDGP